MSFSAAPITRDTAVIEIGFSLDFNNASVFRSTARDQIDAGIRNFILDFKSTRILDSTGLGEIFFLYKRLSRWSGKILFASVPPPVEVVVLLTRTYKVFRQFQSLDDAIDALNANQG